MCGGLTRSEATALSGWDAEMANAEEQARSWHVAEIHCCQLPKVKARGAFPHWAYLFRDSNRMKHPHCVELRGKRLGLQNEKDFLPAPVETVSFSG